MEHSEQGSCLIAEQDDAEHDGVVTGFACFRVTATGAECIFLEVRESNVAALRLDERFGFQPVGRRRGYYTQPAADAVLLRCNLSTPAHAASQRLAEGRNGPDHLT